MGLFVYYLIRSIRESWEINQNTSYQVFGILWTKNVVLHMKYLGAKGNEKNTSYQVYGSVRVNK